MPDKTRNKTIGSGGSRLFGSLLLAGLSLLAAGLWGAAQPQAISSNKAKATYVGSGDCQACHDDIFQSFQKNPHAAIEKDARRGWQGKACESCHGPGSVHAESADKRDILNPATAAAAQADRNCLACHQNQATQVGRIQGGHARSQVSCASCHPVHKSAASPGGSLPVSSLNALCAGCHKQEWAAFQKPYKHKLAEGAAACTDCHNPHGSWLGRSLTVAAANEPGCLNCHGDKRGPFAYEHAPVRLEGCTACHQPHGSANPHMLTRSEVRFLCLECHAAKPAASVATKAQALGGIPTSAHDLGNPRYRNCTICHVKIHGSHISRALLR